MRLTPFAAFALELLRCHSFFCVHIFGRNGRACMIVLRYFILRGDGTFRGYKAKPAKDTDAPINFFDIGNSILTADDSLAKKGKFGIVIKFMQVRRIV